MWGKLINKIKATLNHRSKLKLVRRIEKSDVALYIIGGLR